MEEQKPNGIEEGKFDIKDQQVSPFENLVSYRNNFELTQEFIDKWVVPYFMHIGYTDEHWVSRLISIKPKITSEIIEKNLGDNSWQARSTGAFFAAITDQNQYIDIIGTHLLKSEVTYAGANYCMVLASFNTPMCVEYLNRYLNYYLKRPDLCYDQREALEAILYLDGQNATDYFKEHLPNWESFLSDKSHWAKEINTEFIEKRLAVINKVRNRGN